MTGPSVAVVGAGLAGLVAACELADAGLEVRVFEREPAVGGRAGSTRDGEFVFDRGFRVLLTAYPEARRQLDYGALSLRPFSPGAVVCRPDHRSVVADPFRAPSKAVETAMNPDFTLGDKLRVLALRRELRGRSPGELPDGPDAAIEASLRERGFSSKFVENFARPLFGTTTLDPSLSTSKAVFEATFAALAAGDVAVPARGMAAVPKQLAVRARERGVEIGTGTEVRAVDGGRSDDGTGEAGGDGDATVSLSLSGETVTADAAVVAADPKSARELTGVGTVPTAARGCVTGFYALPAESWPGTGGRLLLNAGGDGPTVVAPVSEVAPEHAPDGVALLSATFPGDREETDAELAALTRDALASWYPELSLSGLEAVHTARVPFAQFAQPPGFADRLPGNRAPGGRVYLAGDYTEWSSVQGAMASGRAAAEAVLADLQVRP